MSIREEIKTTLKELPRELSTASIATYTSVLHSIAKAMDVATMSELKALDEGKVLEYVETKKNLSSKKTLLSALVLITDSENYRKQMVQYSNEVNANYRKQTIQPENEDNFLTPNEVKERHEKAQKDLKQSPTASNYVTYLITALMSGVTENIPPRRLEWADVKVKNYDVQKDNYLNIKTSTVVFNHYKTHSTYGQQTVKIPKDIMVIIRKWLKINDSEYLLTSKTGKKLSASQLSSLIGTIYSNSKIGISSLRKTFTSNLYKDLPMVSDLVESAHKMGHSLQTSMVTYNKKNIKRDKK